MNFAGFAQSLVIMVIGMGGGLLVMGIICLMLMGLYRIGKRSSEKEA